MLCTVHTQRKEASRRKKSRAWVGNTRRLSPKKNSQLSLHVSDKLPKATQINSAKNHRADLFHWCYHTHTLENQLLQARENFISPHPAPGIQQGLLLAHIEPKLPPKGEFVSNFQAITSYQCIFMHISCWFHFKLHGCRISLSLSQEAPVTKQPQTKWLYRKVLSKTSTVKAQALKTLSDNL